MARFFYYDYMPSGWATSKLFERAPALERTQMFVIRRGVQNDLESGKFKPPYIDKICLTHGRPGFYFVQVQYVDNIDQVLAAESAERNALQVAALICTTPPCRCAIRAWTW